MTGSQTTPERTQLASEARFGLGSIMVGITALAGSLALLRSAALVHDAPKSELAASSGAMLGFFVGAVLGFIQAPGDGRGRDGRAWKLLGVVAGMLLGVNTGVLATAPANPLLGLGAGLTVVVMAALVRGK